MVAYIKEVAQSIMDSNDADRGLMEALYEEVIRLDARDFLPPARAVFVRVKARLKTLVAVPKDLHDMVFLLNARETATNIVRVLEFYEGEGSRADHRVFDFVKDPEFRAVVERDYRELSLILLPSEAWKSTVVMAGSILEAILYDKLTADAGMLAKALSAIKAPKKGDLKKGEWRLQDLIEVAVELGALPKTRSSAIDTILRDYRNFVHPVKEVRLEHPCTEAEALMAKGALDSVCNQFASS